MALRPSRTCASIHPRCGSPAERTKAGGADALSAGKAGGRTDAQHAELLANGIAAREAGRAGLHFDPKSVVKLYTPHWYGRWLLTAIDPVHTYRAYGLCDSGHGLPELGFVSLRDLEDVHGKFKFKVVPDHSFVADKQISAYATIARTRGLIDT